jgi:type IV pilus assembly protein PilW
MPTGKSKSKRNNHSGATLIELMISQIIVVVVLSATLSLIAPAISGFATHTAVSDMQESGRIALDLLDHSIRQAGYRGCSQKANIVNVIDPENPHVSAALTSWAYEHYRIRGYDAEDSDSMSALLGTDWTSRRLRHEDTFIGDLLMLREARGPEFRVVYHDPSSQTISFEGDITDRIARGQIIELNDCHQATALQIHRLSNPVYRSSTDSTLVHYGSEASVNCTASTWGGDNLTEVGARVLLGGDQHASCATEASRGLYSEYQFAPGTSAHKVYSSIYYLGTRDESGESYLYRTGTADDGARVYTEALIEGIENLRLLYGIDLNTDGTPDEYRDANRLDVQRGDWSRVVSVKVWLVINSLTAHANAPSDPVVVFPNRSGEMVNCSSGQEASAFICPPPHQSVDSDHTYTRRVIHKEIYLRNPIS